MHKKSRLKIAASKIRDLLKFKAFSLDFLFSF